jgi:hypothetical protein
MIVSWRNHEQHVIWHTVNKPQHGNRRWQCSRMDDVTIEERSAAGIERTGLNLFQDVSQD